MKQNPAPAKSFQSMKLDDLLPILTLFISFFIFHQFHWSEATNFILAALVGLVTFGIMAGSFKIDHPKMNLRSLYLQIGLLSLIFVIIYLHGFLHWKSIGSVAIRMAVMFVLAVVFIAFLFRAIRTLMEFKAKAKVNARRNK
jgi:uncharacterized membrane protein